MRTRCNPLLLTALITCCTAPVLAQETDRLTPPPTAPYGTPVPDDRYQFDPAGSEALTLELSRDGESLQFIWPQTATSDWDTALLGLHSLGAEADPWIEISAGALHLEQYLDPNAWGLRWLNLGALRTALKPGAPIRIRAHQLTLDERPATLRLFANHLPLDKPILVIAPHPDDAEIAAFGLYADRNATIVTITAGNAGDFNYRATIPTAPEHYRMKGYLRAVDSVTVPWQGGIPPERTFNLGYFDATLATMQRSPTQAIPELFSTNTDVLPYRRANPGRLRPVESRSNSWQHLIADLAAILETVEPAVIVMPHPLLDGHSDHAYAAVALVETLAQWDGEPVFLLYTNHAARDRYPWGPAGSPVTLPPWSQSDLPVQRIYAHALDTALVRRKLFALESMHDLRLSPEEQMTRGRTELMQRPDYPRNPDTDYFRRAPRANELFLAYDRDGVRAIIHTFLAGQNGSRKQ